jgi:AcrR family transcriptional regulator
MQLMHTTTDFKRDTGARSEKAHSALLCAVHDDNVHRLELNSSTLVSWSTHMQARKPDKRSRLVCSAMKLFHERGYDGTSIADIAQDAQVQSGNVYYYFKSKDEIAAAAVQQLAARLRALQEVWTQEPDPRKRLQQWVQHVLDNAAIMVRFGCPASGLGSALRKAKGSRQLLDQSASVLLEGEQWLQAQFRALNCKQEARELAMHVMSGVQGAVLLAHVMNDPEYISNEVRRLQRWLRTL